MEYNMPQDTEKIKDDSQKNFENALTRLEEIAAELEKGGLSLADMTALAKEGMELSDYCSAQLKRKIKDIPVFLHFYQSLHRTFLEFLTVDITKKGIIEVKFHLKGCCF